MYNVVKTVEKDGRRIGFVLREINVEKTYISQRKIHYHFCLIMMRI